MGQKRPWWQPGTPTPTPSRGLRLPCAGVSLSPPRVGGHLLADSPSVGTRGDLAPLLRGGQRGGAAGVAVATAGRCSPSNAPRPRRPAPLPPLPPGTPPLPRGRLLAALGTPPLPKGPPSRDPPAFLQHPKPFSLMTLMHFLLLLIWILLITAQLKQGSDSGGAPRQSHPPPPAILHPHVALSFPSNRDREDALPWDAPLFPLPGAAPPFCAGFGRFPPLKPRCRAGCGPSPSP